MEGPLNYLGSLYRGVPIGITVEGANIVTRSLIQFGQGAIRSHPYLLKEMMALQDTDRARGVDAFDQAFWAHVGHSIANTFRAWGRAWTGGLFAPAPDAGAASPFYRQLSRHASAFALAVDLALLSLGGGVKRQEMVSARFGDILSELYLSCAALKRRIHAIGPRRLRPSDRDTAQCAEILTNPCPARDRLTIDLFKPTRTEGGHADGVAVLERAFAMTVAVQPIRDRMQRARVRDIDEAVKQRTITVEDSGQLKAAADAVSAAIAVDDFAAEELMSRGVSNKGDVSSQTTSQPWPAAAE